MQKTFIKILAVFAALLILGIGGLILYRAGLNKTAPTQSAFSTDDEAKSPGADMGVDPNVGDYAPEATAEPDSHNISIPGWTTIEIPAGKTEVSVDFPNPEANAGKYYLTFQLKIKDTGEILYQSELVPPGKTIQHATLSRPLEAGSYAGVVHVQPYLINEDRSSTNNADIDVEIIVK